jgi:hypothetical protein
MSAALMIEALFRPTNRYRDLLREERGDYSYQLPEELTELDIFPDLSPEHVLATGITWEDFCRFLSGKIIWMGPGAYVCDGFIFFDYPDGYRFIVQLGSLDIRDPRLLVYAATEPETAAAATAATFDFFVHLLATIKKGDALIEGFSEYSIPISGPGLFHFFQESQDNLRIVTLKGMILNDEQIQALATTEFRPGMKVILHY